MQARMPAIRTTRMKVRVLFFGATADEAGTDGTEIEVASTATSDAALSAILSQFPELTSGRKREDLLFALNQEYVRGDEIVKEGDELAVFTAVSGG